MDFEAIKKQVRADFIRRGLETLYESEAISEVDLAALALIPDNDVIGRKVLRHDSDGNPTHWKDVTAKEMKDQRIKELDNARVRIEKLKILSTGGSSGGIEKSKVEVKTAKKVRIRRF